VWVGKSVVFKGELSSAEDLTVDGHLEAPSMWANTA